VIALWPETPPDTFSRVREATKTDQGDDSMADSPTPVLDTLMGMTASSLQMSSLDNHSLMLVRLAAMAAVGATPASYVLSIGPAQDSGVTVEDVQGVLSAVAPIIGTSRVIAATDSITRALGFAVDVATELGYSDG